MDRDHVHHSLYIFPTNKRLQIGVFLIEGKLIYNVVLVSGVQQSDSAMHIHICMFFFITGY